MFKVTKENLFSVLKENEDKMIIFAKMSDPIREAIRDLWDDLIQDSNFIKFGFEGWRECRDRGPQQHVVYAIRKISPQASVSKLREEAETPKFLTLNGIDINSKLKDIEERLTLLEIAVAGIYNRRIPDFDTVLSVIRDGIQIKD